MHRSFSARALAGASLVTGLLAGCADQGRPAPSFSHTPRTPSPKLAALARQGADAFLAVDCRLPPQVRKLGRQVSFLSGQKVVKTAAGDCETRGGEYVAYDRADLATALGFWMSGAQAGDAKAQTYVGELFERGVGGARPDHASAALWYRRAAEQGHGPAQINLGQLHEQGLGVPKDPTEAGCSWSRTAATPARSRAPPSRGWRPA